MEGKTPLVAGFKAIAPQWRIWLVPMFWDLFKLGLAALLAPIGLGWIRWDFNTGPSAGFMNVELVPAPALPSAEQVGASFGATPPENAGWDWYLAALPPMLLMTVLDPLVRAGYLNQINAALRGIQPDLKVFLRGVRRFGLQQLILTLLWIPMGLVVNAVYSQNPQWGMVVDTVLVAAFYMAQFIIVSDDAWAIQAVAGAPLLVLTCLGNLILPTLLSMFTSAVLGVGALAAGEWAWVFAIPIWAYAGSILAGMMMVAVHSDMSTRSEPGLPWTCRKCKGQNAQAADTCAVCGQPRQAAG